MKKISEELMRKYLDAEAKIGLKGPYWEKYLRGKVAGIVELDDGIILAMEKETIETRFCFGESGYDFDDAMRAANRAQTDEEWFKNENLRKLDGKIALLRSGNEVYINLEAPVTEYFYKEECWRYNVKTGRELSDGEKAKILDVLEEIREVFAKRIDNYLKRYGLSKVYSWTYWRDA